MLKEFETRLNEDGNTYLYEIAEYPCKEDFTGPKKIYEMMCENFQLDHMAEEYLYALAMNAKGKRIAILQISHGSVNSSICNPREILVRMLLAGATTFALIHNHPSGDPMPSSLDVEASRRVLKASNLVGIEMSDHIIIGRNKYISLREEHLLN